MDCSSNLRNFETYPRAIKFVTLGYFFRSKIIFFETKLNYPVKIHVNWVGSSLHIGTHTVNPRCKTFYCGSGVMKEAVSVILQY